MSDPGTEEGEVKSEHMRYEGGGFAQVLDIAEVPLAGPARDLDQSRGLGFGADPSLEKEWTTFFHRPSGHGAGHVAAARPAGFCAANSGAGEPGLAGESVQEVFCIARKTYRV